MSYINAKIIDTIISTIQSNKNLDLNILVFIGLVGAINYLGKLAESVRQYSQVKLWLTIGSDYSHMLIKKISSFDLEIIHSKKYSSLINKVKSKGEDSVYGLILMLHFTLAALASTIVTLFIIFRISYVIPVIIILSTAPKMYISYKYGRYKYGIWASKADIVQDYFLSKSYLESDRYYQELRIFNLAGYFNNRINNYTKILSQPKPIIAFLK